MKINRLFYAVLAGLLVGSNSFAGQTDLGARWSTARFFGKVALSGVAVGVPALYWIDVSTKKSMLRTDDGRRKLDAEHYKNDSDASLALQNGGRSEDSKAGQGNGEGVRIARERVKQSTPIMAGLCGLSAFSLYGMWGWK